jgi:hypothetical protein
VFWVTTTVTGLLVMRSRHTTLTEIDQVELEPEL